MGFNKLICITIIFLLLFACKSPKGNNVNNQDETSDTIVKTDDNKGESEIVIIKDSTDDSVETTPPEDSTDDTVAEVIEEVTEETHIDKRLQFELEDNMDRDQLEAYMEGLFNTIEDKIAEGDFEGWYSSLSRRNKKRFSNTAYLENISRRAAELSEKNIVLKTAEDYFVYVVVPSRAGKSLKYNGYKYIDKFHVNVISTLDGSSKFTYNFIYEDNSWKLDL